MGSPVLGYTEDKCIFGPSGYFLHGNVGVKGHKDFYEGTDTEEFYGKRLLSGLAVHG